MAAPPRLLHRVPEAAAILGVSDDTVWKQIRAGHLRARKLGRFLVITDADLRAYAEGLPFAAVARPAPPANVVPITPARPARGRVHKLLSPVAGGRP